ncbi:hypothetical protein LB507_005431, partial [Fusarium sp. FIESC RH6]
KKDSIASKVQVDITSASQDPSTQLQIFPLARNITMGATISQLWTPPTIAVGVVSIPSAGKTSIIRKLSGGQDPIPPLNETVNNTIFTVRGQEYDVFDYSSDRRIRGVWRKLLFQMRAIIFAIDSADRENMDDARDALWEVLYEEQLELQPILILANKQDKPVSASNEAKRHE